MHQSIADEVVRRVQQRFDAMIVGNPMNAETEIGPLARHDLKQHLLDQIQRALQAGARSVTHRGANDAGVEGYYVNPTLLVDVDASNPAFREELFGPVATVTTFTDEYEAIELANTSLFGLGAAVCSQDLHRASTMARKLECGTVFINDFVRSDARLPFGGVKKSGYGRELGSWGMLEFVNVKNVTIG